MCVCRDVFVIVHNVSSLTIAVPTLPDLSCTWRVLGSTRRVIKIAYLGSMGRFVAKEKTLPATYCIREGIREQERTNETRPSQLSGVFAAGAVRM